MKARKKKKGFEIFVGDLLQWDNDWCEGTMLITNTETRTSGRVWVDYMWTDSMKSYSCGAESLKNTRLFSRSFHGN